MKAQRNFVAATIAAGAVALLSMAAASANPAVSVGCGVTAVNASIHKGSYYAVYVTNTTSGTLSAGTLMNWTLQSPDGNKSGGQYLPSALAPKASEYLVEVPLNNVAVPARATCGAAMAATYSAPGYGSGSGTGSSSPSHGRPPMRPQ